MPGTSSMPTTILETLEGTISAINHEGYETKHLEYSIHLLKKGYPINHEFDYKDPYDPFWSSIPTYKEFLELSKGKQQ